MEMALHLPPTPSGDAYVTAEKLQEKQKLYPLDIMLCRDCGHSQLSVVVDPEILYKNYIYTTSISLGLSDHFKEYAKSELKKIKPAKGAFVLDIGSNDGTLLAHFKSYGLKVLGVDPAPSIKTIAEGRGVKTLTGYFNSRLAEKIKKDKGPASIITANNVFANIDDLSNIIKGIKNLLADDGVFILETSYLLPVIQKLLVETVFHEHISYFSVKPLKLFFKNHGMDLFDVETIPTKGGSIRCCVQRSGGKRPMSCSVEKIILVEEENNIHKKEGFEKLDNQINFVKNELIMTLNELNNKGKKIAGYGASVGVTTLIYFFDVRQYVEYLIDDNPVKHNRFSPGYHIPVLSSDAIYEKQPDYIVIFAWGYADMIIKKNRKFCDNGGHFIIPLPEVKITR
jgi:SAM-dependent methyltransferase